MQKGRADSNLCCPVRGIKAAHGTPPQRPMPTVRIPFPCAVYSRDLPGDTYSFSHFCRAETDKAFPPSLRVRDLAAHDRGANCARMMRTPFLVLVAGDRAQCVSVHNARHRDRTWFLYTRSPQSCPVSWPPRVDEVEPGFVALAFCSTLAQFRQGELQHVSSFQRNLLLLPARIRAGEVARLARFVMHKIHLSVQGSVWLMDDDRVNEGEWVPHSQKRRHFYGSPEPYERAVRPRGPPPPPA